MTPDQRALLTAYVASARWFGGKGRSFEVTDVTRLVLAPGVSTTLVRVAFTDPSVGSGETAEAMREHADLVADEVLAVEMAEVASIDGDNAVRDDDLGLAFTVAKA